MLFITTANALERIPRSLQDRLEVIRIAGYLETEKLQIAKKYLLKKQREVNGLKEENLEFSDQAILDIIRYYTREAGVRHLERELAAICRKSAVAIVKTDRNAHVKISASSLSKYLGPPKFRYGMAETEPQIGVATGFAWTELGGELLSIEVTIVPGRSKLTITGLLGMVMQESARAALSYVRSRAEQLGLSPDFYQVIFAQTPKKVKFTFDPDEPGHHANFAFSSADTKLSRFNGRFVAESFSRTGFVSPFRVSAKPL